MDLDVIDLAKTECYKCHKKGHISRNCRSGKKDSTNNTSSSSGDRRKPNLLVMDFVPPFQDSENSYVLKASKESSEILIIYQTWTEERNLRYIKKNIWKP